MSVGSLCSAPLCARPSVEMKINPRTSAREMTCLIDGFINSFSVKDAQTGHPARPQTSQTRRRTLWGTLRILAKLRTKLGAGFSILLSDFVELHQIRPPTQAYQRTRHNHNAITGLRQPFGL